MSPSDPVAAPQAIAKFQQAWMDGITGVLGQLAGAAFSASALKLEDTLAPGQLTPEKGVWARFIASGKLVGELGFFCSFADAMRLAHLLTSDQYDPSAIFSDEHRDACAEVFQQFAGAVATDCKTVYGGEVQFAANGREQPQWKWNTEAGWRFHQGDIALSIRMYLSAEFESSVNVANARATLEAQRKQEGAKHPPVEAPTPQSEEAHPAPESAAAGDSNEANLSLLLDVELDANLRFGQRQMQLREILELRPGLVIELDKRLQEPADLLVAGRLVARGEVVIVDGNYGLRITEIVRPQDRLESVRT